MDAFLLKDVSALLEEAWNHQQKNYISEICVTKVRYRPTTGKLGSVQLVYDPYNWDIRAVTLKELLELREGY